MDTLNLLVLGASGMAGHLITTYLREKGHMVDTLSATKKMDEATVLLDVTHISQLEDYLNHHHYDGVINAVGLLIAACAHDEAKAIFINAYLPHFLENYYKPTDTKVIHLSTDCVFSGLNGPYVEAAPYDGPSTYARVKALGELNNTKDLTFRMSIIGPDLNDEGIGLFNWFMHQKGQIFGFTEEIWNGITTLELAKAIDQALSTTLSGLYHLVPSTTISKYNLLLLFQETFQTSHLTILPKAVHPSHKVLVNTRTDFDFVVRSYPSMIQEMKTWIESHQALYPHYFNRS